MNNYQPLNKIGMKRLMKYILLMIVPSIYLAACSSSKEEVIEPSITISGNNSAIVSSKGENISFSFNSTFNWTASSNMSWCKITPANGIGGNATIQVTINENTSYDNREAVIRIVSEGISTAFNITQIQKDGILIAKDKYIVSGKNTTLEFKIDTNVEFNVTTPAESEEQQILADEIFRHKSLSKFKRAVNRCMAQSNFNTPNIFDLMDDDKNFKKKKKNKKKHSYDDDFSFMDNDKPKKKKKKGMSKEDREAESMADKRAKELYRYHLEKAMKGEFDRKGYGFDF